VLVGRGRRLAIPSSVNLGAPLEATVDRLVKAGRYGSRSEILREGVRLVEDREAKLAKVNAAILRGLADAEAGRVRPAEEVFAELKARFQGMIDQNQS
jgi:antitoxin ParD1/3/4